MSYLKYSSKAFFVLLSLSVFINQVANAASTEIIPIKAVVVTMFEDGEVMGNDPGELQLWLERGNFSTKLDFPLGMYDLYLNKEGVLKNSEPYIKHIQMHKTPICYYGCDTLSASKY